MVVVPIFGRQGGRVVPVPLDRANVSLENAGLTYLNLIEASVTLQYQTRFVLRVLSRAVFVSDLSQGDDIFDEATGLHQVRKDAWLPAGRAELDDPPERQRHQR